jgi:magnesium chelatase family protein
MLAKRIPTILPPMTFEEALETTKIHSVAGILPSDTALVSVRPYRSPHHTISDVALVGGGTIAKPGEISYAHHGVLFLDECLSSKRMYLKLCAANGRRNTISRSKISVEYPCNFMLASAMNPVLQFWQPNQECTCAPSKSRNTYQRFQVLCLIELIYILMQAVNT